ncbi:MAG: hypothetical protein KDB23_25090 [Planctomycetales bacterium]|nr:hypothetical protein [Planctomycetales bacterium]
MPVTNSRIGSQQRWLCVPSIVLVFLLAANQNNLAAEFTRIADTSTPTPNGAGNFLGFDKPVLSGSTIAFSSGQAIYLAPSTGGAISVVVDLDDAIPGGNGNFTEINSVRSSSETILAFRARGSNDQLGIYAASTTDQTISVIADRNTAIPNGSGRFSGMSLESVSGSMIAFSGGNTSSNQRGIYVGSTNGGLTHVADQNTAIPGGVGTFDRLGQPGVALHDNMVAWKGEGMDSQRGIYIGNVADGSIVRVADTNFMIPNGIGNFRHFYVPYLSDEIVAFEGLGDSAQEGIYAAYLDGAILARVADLNTPVPMGDGNFSKLFFNGNTSVSVSGNMIAFRGLDASGKAGIYTNLINEDKLAKVVATGDLLDGRYVSDLRFGVDSLDSGQLAFLASFTDGSAGVYTTSVAVPEPNTLILAVIGLVMVMRRFTSQNRNTPG